ncbi:DUF3991 domain-containing protein [uncultured Oscillibacter sp.]|nr:DUF3991 domain-containing protein [uncultured Oscillibacter sp.]
MFAYLQKRGLAAQVIRGFIDSGLLYENSLHHNCVFVGRDSGGKFAALAHIPLATSRRGARRGGPFPPDRRFKPGRGGGRSAERASVALQFSRPGVAAGRDFVIQGKVAAFPDPPTLTGGY